MNLEGIFLLIVSFCSSISQSPPAFVKNGALIVGAQSDKCINPISGSIEIGVPVVINTCQYQDDPSQVWFLRSVRSGVFMIVNSKSKLCLEASAAVKSANVIQRECQNKSLQSWAVVHVGSGNWKIHILSSTLSLDVSQLRSDENSPIHVYWYKKTSNQHWQFLQAPSMSKTVWTEPTQLPLVPMAGANLGDGRVVFWSSALRNGYGPGDPSSQTHFATFDVFTSAIIDAIVPVAADLFCPGTVMLDDGSLMIAGGISSGKTTIFNSTAWTAGPKLNIPRGYNTVTLLSDGSAFTIGGSWSGGIGHKLGELWTRSGHWKKLAKLLPKDLLTADKAGTYRADNHMWLISHQAGWIFHAGPSKMMHWISTSGQGRIVRAGLRANDSDAMNGNAIVFRAGKVLAVGGAPSYENSTPTNGAFVIDYSRGPSFPATARRIKGMAFARAFHNSVLLPNGHVVVVGGQSVQTKIFSDANAVLTPELWNPETEKFTQLPPMQTPRTYHSIALLLLDGRVLSAGGGGCRDGCAANHPNFEVLTPPYLWDLKKQRPIITWAPKMATMGSTIRVAAHSASVFALVRASSVTHSINADQRRFRLQASPSKGLWKLSVPTMADGAIPGNYMLFALSAAGTPSIAQVIRITG